MITPWTIYWITRLDNIQVCVAISLVACLVAAIALGISSLLATIEGDWDRTIGRVIRRGWKITLMIAIPTLIIGTFTPTTKEAAAIYLIPKIANNEQVQQIPDNAMRLLNAKLQEWIGDVAEKGGEKK